jgi:hypothetical protein
MGSLKAGMTHDEAAEHLRQEVIGTFRYETGRLLARRCATSFFGRLLRLRGPAFFGAVRSTLSDLDYVAALYVGAQGRARRELGQRNDTVTFLREVFVPSTGNASYQSYGEHLRDMFRVGTVHFRAPKLFENPACSTPIISWGLMEHRTERLSGTTVDGTHLQPVAINARTTILPVAINVLFEDFVTACEYFATLLENENAAGGHALLDRWRSVADVLATPEAAPNLQW